MTFLFESNKNFKITSFSLWKWQQKKLNPGHCSGLYCKPQAPLVLFSCGWGWHLALGFLWQNCYTLRARSSFMGLTSFFGSRSCMKWTLTSSFYTSSFQSRAFGQFWLFKAKRESFESLIKIIVELRSFSKINQLWFNPCLILF